MSEQSSLDAHWLVDGLFSVSRGCLARLIESGLPILVQSDGPIPLGKPELLRYKEDGTPIQRLIMVRQVTREDYVAWLGQLHPEESEGFRMYSTMRYNFFYEATTD